MNRQAFPSIVLSVSIVCSFAVALHRREVPTAGKHAAEVEAAGPARPPAGPIAASGPGHLDTGPKVRPAGGGQGGRSVAPAVHESSERTPRGARSSPIPRKRAAIASHPLGPKVGRPAFTVARFGETIADVARRVYGTTAVADGLWRANRDVLREPGAAIPTGTVLHTPPAPLR